MGANGLGLAVGAGLVAALNPCGFAMLPAYLTLVVRGGGGIVLAALGVWQLLGRDLRLPVRDPLARGARWGPTAALGSMFGYGISYALASLSCTVGPFLVAVLFGVGLWSWQSGRRRSTVAPAMNSGSNPSRDT